MSESSQQACFFCAGDGEVTARPGDVKMPCPFCHGTGDGKDNAKYETQQDGSEK